MCYGSHCAFEDSMGECKVKLWLNKEIYEELGASSCDIGGAAFSVDENGNPLVSLEDQKKAQAIMKEKGWAW